MGPQPHQNYLICLNVNPYQEKIALYVTLHTAFIIPFQHVWIVFFRNFLSRFQHTEQF